MVSNLRSGVLGSRARSELKECWQMRSRLMGGWSGRANSVLNQMCGRGGVAGDVTVTSKYRQAVAAKVRRMVFRPFDVEWRRRQKSSESGSREQGAQSED